eukprot:UN09782
MNTYVTPKLLANAPIYGLMLNMNGTMRRKATTILNGVQKYIKQINKIHNNTKTVLQNTSTLLQNAITTIIDPFLYSRKLAVQQLTTMITRDDSHLNNWLYKYLHQSAHNRQSVIYDNNKWNKFTNTPILSTIKYIIKLSTQSCVYINKTNTNKQTDEIPQPTIKHINFFNILPNIIKTIADNNSITPHLYNEALRKWYMDKEDQRNVNVKNPEVRSE